MGRLVQFDRAGDGRVRVVTADSSAAPILLATCSGCVALRWAGTGHGHG